MKKLMMVGLMMATVAVAFSGCKKQETAGQKLDKMINKTEKTTQNTVKSTQKAADKAAQNVQKTVNDAAKK